ncbi:hypothetical protein F2Q69_00054954 [Brassica cretica]|uniref:Uncharacterized protein n=1 Tax=Brassica cretica TaxID=69181 RepID=A0A8S9N2A1_BRACR|nr:hypothetical protein F2Q69_00054954 [Brassica cretica]
MDEETRSSSRIRSQSRDSEDITIETLPWCRSTPARLDRLDLIQANSSPKVPHITKIPMADFIPNYLSSDLGPQLLLVGPEKVSIDSNNGVSIDTPFNLSIVTTNELSIDEPSNLPGELCTGLTCLLGLDKSSSACF